MGACGKKERKKNVNMERIFFFFLPEDSSSSSSHLSLRCLYSIFLSLSLASLLLSACDSFDFSAFPSLILQRSHSGFRADHSKSPTEEEWGKEISRERRRGQNGGRLCLRKGQTEIQVTNLSKSPAARESVTERQQKKREGKLERDLLQEIYLNIPG